MVTALPFFHLFLLPIFVYFAKKVNLWCLQLYLFCLFLSLSSFYYAGNPYSSFLWIWGQCISSPHIRISTTMSLPPHPSAPGGGGMPGHSGRRGNKLYLAGAAQPVVEMPPLQQPPGIELPTQQPPVDELLTLQGAALLSTSADDDNDDAPPIMVPSMFDNPDLDDTAPSCIAGLLCCNPNSNTDEYCLCMNCNGEAHTICTKQLNFQAPADEKLVITPKDFCNMGKEHFKKTHLSHCQNVVFCLLYKARMIQKKLHPTKKLTIKQKVSSSDLGAPCKSKKGKIVGP
jgi:hypothetical protein